MLLSIFSICVVVCTVNSQEITGDISAAKNNAEVNNTITPTDSASCQTHNKDCKACVANSKCYYCDTDDKCNFHIQNIIADGECNINNAHFLTCKVNFKYMMIIIGSLSGIAVLIITICCCYCCCKRKGIKISKDDLKWARQKEERQLAAAERRKERADRTEEIRKKYEPFAIKDDAMSLIMDAAGLVRDSNPYQKFDA